MTKYEELLEEFESYCRSANGAKSDVLMQHIADRLHESMTRYNWVGFYFMEAPAFDALVLGPCAGSFVPTPRIPLDKGLCGAAATSGRTVAVNNVAADPRYLGSDMVKSNLVAPIFAKTSEAKTSEAKKRVVAEICIESYFANTFTAAETAFIEACAALVGRYIEKSGDRAI